MTNLDCALVVLCGILIDVVVGADGLAEFIAHDHSRAFCARSATKEHDPRASVRIGALRMAVIITRAIVASSNLAYLEQPNSNSKCSASTPQRTLIIRHRPRILREILQDARKLKFTLCNGHKESIRAVRGGWRSGLSGTRRGDTRGAAEAEHVL